jgi:CheY-like chemotaxis protein
MKRILIVFNDVVLLSVFKRWIARSSTEQILFFAKDGKKAIDILKSYPIDLVITELTLPEMDGLELITLLPSLSPTIKLALLISSDSTTNSETLKQLRSFYFIHAPHSLKDFIRFVRVLAVAEFQAFPISGILMADFLQLIEYQRKTCLVAIEHLLLPQRGLVYFEEGVLYDAVCAELKASAAMVELLGWQQGKISFKSFDKKPVSRKIRTPLADFIAGKAALVLPKEVEKPISPPPPPEVQVVNVTSTATLATDHVASLPAESAVKIATPMEITPQIQALSLKIRALNWAETLAPLQEIGSYSAFVIFDIAGHPVIDDHLSDSAYHSEAMSRNAVIMIQRALAILNSLALGKFNFIQITAEGGVFQTTWVIENQFGAVVLLTSEAKNTGLVKVHLDRVCRYVRDELALTEPLLN